MAYPINNLEALRALQKYRYGNRDKYNEDGSPKSTADKYHDRQTRDYNARQRAQADGMPEWIDGESLENAEHRLDDEEEMRRERSKNRGVDPNLNRKR